MTIKEASNAAMEYSRIEGDKDEEFEAHISELYKALTDTNPKKLKELLDAQS